MPQQLVCKKCGTINPPRANFCKYCRERLQYKKLLDSIKWVSFAGVAVTWALFSVKLFSITKPVFFPSKAGASVNGNINGTVINEGSSGAVVNNSNTGPVINAPNSIFIYQAPPKPPKPAEVEQEDYVSEAPDNQNRRATFDIYLFSDEYRWQLGSWEELENGMNNIPFTPQMRANLNSAEEIICIGASSEEIKPGLSLVEGRKLEEYRAERRANTISKWVRTVLHKHIVVRKLNIGHHTPESKDLIEKDEYSDQRRVIIVLVLKQEVGINIDEALRNAFEQQKGKHPIYETILSKYSLTDGPKFNWSE